MQTVQKILILSCLCIVSYSGNYSMASEILWNYYKDEVNDSVDETDNNDKMINNNKRTTSICFKYKTKITGKTPVNTSRLFAEVLVPLKYFSNFCCRSLDLPLINGKIEFGLSWSKKFIVTEVSKTSRADDLNAGPVVNEVATKTTGATF